MTTGLLRLAGSQALLQIANRLLPCAIGRAGVRSPKLEGDRATPSGRLVLRRVLYRADRLSPPHCSPHLTVEPIAPLDGWCDDPASADYNRQIRLPHPARHERLWREDRLYDVIGVLGHNDDPPRAPFGSAIFLHPARPDLAPTDGCICLPQDDLLWALRQGLDAIEVPAPG